MVTGNIRHDRTSRHHHRAGAPTVSNRGFNIEQVCLSVEHVGLADNEVIDFTGVALVRSQALIIDDGLIGCANHARPRHVAVPCSRLQDLVSGHRLSPAVGIDV